MEVSIAPTFFKASKNMSAKSHGSLRSQKILFEKLSFVHFFAISKKGWRFGHFGGSSKNLGLSCREKAVALRINQCSRNFFLNYSHLAFQRLPDDCNFLVHGWSSQCPPEHYCVLNVLSYQLLCMCLIHLACEYLSNPGILRPWQSSFAALFHDRFQHLQDVVSDLYNETLTPSGKHCHLEYCSAMPEPYYWPFDRLLGLSYPASSFSSFFWEDSSAFYAFRPGCSSLSRRNT